METEKIFIESGSVWAGSSRNIICDNCGELLAEGFRLSDGIPRIFFLQNTFMDAPSPFDLLNEHYVCALGSETGPVPCS